jgi:phosphatidylethanolamine/phosphatidyl-N-methylethanolamine N-methyltransferase
MAGQLNGAHRGSSDPHRSKIYAEFSHLYDLIFQRIFFPRIANVINSLHIEPGARVLEVGVGTGLSLSAYPAHCDVVGIDLAQEMLDQAEDKINERGWKHITLRQMDALNLTFPDDSFDYVMAFHVVSVVPDATKLLEEARRVLRPNGTLVVINHFRSERPIIGSLVDMADPVTRKLGWRTTLRLVDMFNGAPIAIQRQFKTSPRSLFTVVIARNQKDMRATG